MKNKSKAHKSTNRFKFTPFSERVSNIDVRRGALYHLDHVYADSPEGEQTYFHNTLQKWKVLNLTTEFVTFSKKVNNIETLPQLLFKKNEVIDLILEQLDLKNILNVQPFLELIAVIAKDLQDEFYPYFPRVLKTLLNLLNTKESEQLEWTLICLAYLFKYLRTFLKRDISVVFEAVLPLLSDSIPWYINNFAAESFAFVARDIKDKKKFLHILIKTVSKHKRGVTGCGRLLFEVTRGVGNKFHSCAESFLTFLLESFQDGSIDQTIYFEIITQTVSDMLEMVHSANSETFWTPLMSTIDKTIANYSPTTDTGGFECLLKIIGQALEYKSGVFVTKYQSIYNLVLGLLDKDLPKNVLMINAQIGVLLLLSKNLNLPHENAVTLVKKFLKMPHKNIVLHFVENVVMSASFDVAVLPTFISGIEKLDFDILRVLCKICLIKSPLCLNGINIYSWVKYPIDFESNSQSHIQYIMNNLQITEDEDMKKMLEFPEEFLSSLICLPHVRRVNSDIVEKTLGSLLLKLNQQIQEQHSLDLKNLSDEDISFLQNLLFVYAVVLESSIHTINLKTMEEYCTLENIISSLEPFLNQPLFIGALQIVDLLCTVYQRDEVLPLTLLEKIDSILRDNVASPYHEVRLLTTHVYSLFETLMNQPTNIENSVKKTDTFEVFSLCYAVESLKVSVNDYRDQVVKISKMAHGTIQHHLSRDKSYETFALKFALGFMHVNFKLLWDPLQTFILGYAENMKIPEFWNIFFPCLKQSSYNVKENIMIPQVKCDRYSSIDALMSTFEQYSSIADTPDFSLYRIHLWEILYKAPSIFENRNRDVIPLFLDFLKNEFEKPDHVRIGTDEATIVEDDENDVDESINESVSEKRMLNKQTYNSFISLFKVFSTVSNPKSMYLENSLKQIYLDYLMHKNPIIQKIALDCLLKYKNKHLTPYKDHLYNLVDGKKFKDELRSFNLQSETSVIKSDDRSEILPIILRIAYSKMITNIGVDKKGGTQLRKSLVMRFLSGCEETELITFINMSLKHLSPYVETDVKLIDERIDNSIDELMNIAPKKMMGALQLVDSMREQFIKPGQEVLVLRLMKYVVCLGKIVNRIIKRPDLKAGYVTSLKSVRNSCIKSIIRFFEQFEHYKWDFDNDLFMVMDTFIWPTMEKLPIESVLNPTPLLKLFNKWSQFSRYFCLLNVSPESNKDISALVCLLRLLKMENLNHFVNDIAMQILERLLTYDDDLKSMEIVIPSNYLKINQVPESTQLTYGSLILQPHLSDIVDILKLKLDKINPSKLQKRELIILSRVTLLVDQQNTVDKLLSFSLPILIHRIGQGGSEDTLEASINALTDLLSKASNPKQHIRLLIPLFSKVALPKLRKNISLMLKVIGDDEESQTIAKIVCDMNASDEKWIEHPDFERRLSAYNEIYALLETGKLGIVLEAFVIHNCFFTIQNSSDMSLRNAASACLHKIIHKSLLNMSDPSDIEFILQDNALHLIRNSLKSNNDSLRIEAISLLGVLSKECAQKHPILGDLSLLCNKQDIEVDFFENLKHLQYHRQIRAFQKFTNFVKSSPTSFNQKTLTQIIIPLASYCVCSEKFVPKYALVDAAIEAIAACSQFLSWHQYEALLKFYVVKLQTALEYQKQLIKLVSAILDAFHFDMSKASLGGDNDGDILENVLLGDKINADTNLEDILVGIVTEDVPVNSKVIPYLRIQTLSPSTAKRAIAMITQILRQLDWTASQVTEYEMSHKTLKKDESTKRESEDKLKLPMALAIVKLLQKFPQPMLDNNMQSIFVKVCYFLKSPMLGVRASARDIISKIITTVGVSYLSTLLTYLSSLLSRGMHIHILISTVHTVLIALKDSFKAGEIDKHLPTVQKICLDDLFGKASEEKEVVKLGMKTPEAKPSMKSFYTLRILAQNIRQNSIPALIRPFKEIAETSHLKRTVTRVQLALQNISLGLAENSSLEVEVLLKFLLDVFTNSIEKLNKSNKKRKCEDEREERWKKLKPDCFIIAPDPRKTKNIQIKTGNPKSSSNNTHILVEFGLNLLQAVLQKEKISDHAELINDLLPYVHDGMKSNQVKVATAGLKCINTLWVKRFKLKWLNEQIKPIASTVFKILHKYATSGISKKDDNFHLVSNAFKAVTNLIREVKYYSLSADEMKALLLYAEHDIHDSDRQGTAFALLRAIVAAKYKMDEISDIMKKVQELSILSESARVRDETRQVVLSYVINYPLQEKFNCHVNFYIVHLSYSHENGRLSAINMLQMFLEKFSKDVLCQFAEVIYLALGTRLINEDSLNCMKLVIECLENLLKSIGPEKRNELYKITVLLLEDIKPEHSALASQLFLRFVSVENQSFKTKIEQLLPLLCHKLYSQSSVGRFIKLKHDEIDEARKDICFVQVLNLLNVLYETFDVVFKDEKYSKHVHEIAMQCQVFLSHSNVQVRSKSAKCICIFLQNLDVPKLSRCLVNDNDELAFHSKESFKSLTLDLCSQYMPGEVTSELADEVSKNMLILVKICGELSRDGNKMVDDISVIKKLRSALNGEITRTPGSTTIRRSIFHIIDDIMAMSEADKRVFIAKLLMPCIYRETNRTDSSFEELKNIANDLCTKMRGYLGDMIYNDITLKLQAKLANKKKERKQKISQEKVQNPEKAAKRKILMQSKKKNYKKRKLDTMKGKMYKPLPKSVESMDVF